MNIYRLRATALCPLDGSRDHYDVEVRSLELIEVGRLRQYFDDRANEKWWQERLCADAQDEFDAEVRITGSHPSPVEVIAE